MRISAARTLQGAALLLLLPACGGGGGSDGGPPPAPIVAATVGATRLVRYERPTFDAQAMTGPGLNAYSNLTALTYDAQDDVLLAADANSGRLIRVHPTTGAVTPVGPTGFGDLGGLALDPLTRTLYASSLAGRCLLRLDLASGEGTLIGSTGASISGLAFDPAAGILYGIEDPFGRLYTIDPTTGQTTLHMTVSTGTSLAFDPGTGLLYLHADDIYSLLKINPVAKTTTVLPTATALSVAALAFLPGTGRLVGAFGASVYDIHLTTGAPSHAFSPGLGVPNDLAWDPLRGLYYGVSGNQILCAIEPVAGVLTRIGPTGLPAIVSLIRGLAFDAGARVLYATDHQSLLRLDLSTGAATVIGALGVSFVLDLSFDAGSNVLYGIQSGGVLLTINTTTGAATPVGNTGVNVMDTLAFDDATDTLYASSNYDDRLYTLNLSTAAATLVAGLADGWIFGLEFNPTDGRLYGTSLVPGHLVRVDPYTGAAEAVNSVGYRLAGFAWDKAGGILYGVSDKQLLTLDPATWRATHRVTIAATYAPAGLTYDRDRGLLYTIDITRNLQRLDPATGAVSILGATGLLPSGLAYHPGLGALFAIDLAGFDRLFRLNVDTGAATLVGDTGFATLSGLTWDPSTGGLLAYDVSTDQIVRLDPATGAGTGLGRARAGLTALLVLD